MHPLIAAALRLEDLRAVFARGCMYLPVWQSAVAEEIEFMRELGHEWTHEVGA